MGNIDMKRLKKMLNDHDLWLSEPTKGKKIDWVFADLSGLEVDKPNLSKSNLSSSDLSMSKLNGVNLSEANLMNVDLSDADLSDANLCGANLIGANLSRANLSNADLRGSDLYGAIFHETKLNGTNLEHPIIFINTVPEHTIQYINEIVLIGCECYHIDHWLENYKEIGEDNNYSPEEIEIYHKKLLELKETK